MDAKLVKDCTIVVHATCQNNGRENAVALGSFVVLVNDTEVHREEKLSLPVHTINQAAFYALGKALKYIMGHPKRECLEWTILMCNSTVVNLVNGDKEPKNESMVDLTGKIKHWFLHHNAKLEWRDGVVIKQLLAEPPDGDE